MVNYLPLDMIHGPIEDTEEIISTIVSLIIMDCKLVEPSLDRMMCVGTTEITLWYMGEICQNNKKDNNIRIQIVMCLIR
jgi:hypothetical protein